MTVNTTVMVFKDNVHPNVFIARVVNIIEFLFLSKYIYFEYSTVMLITIIEVVSFFYYITIV